MKIFYCGYEIEGTAQEITEFIKMNEPVTVYDLNKTRVQSDSSCNDYYRKLINSKMPNTTKWPLDPLDDEPTNKCLYKKSESEEQNS